MAAFLPLCKCVSLLLHLLIGIPPPSPCFISHSKGEEEEEEEENSPSCHSLV